MAQRHVAVACNCVLKRMRLQYELQHCVMDSCFFFFFAKALLVCFDRQSVQAYKCCLSVKVRCLHTLIFAINYAFLSSYNEGYVNMKFYHKLLKY